YIRRLRSRAGIARAIAAIAARSLLHIPQPDHQDPRPAAARIGLRRPVELIIISPRRTSAVHYDRARLTLREPCEGSSMTVEVRAKGFTAVVGSAVEFEKLGGGFLL